MAVQPVFQFYAELDDYRPAIWRRFQMPGTPSVARLGYILMTLFEMKASHLFCFEQIREAAPGGKRKKRITAMDIIRYEIPDEDSDVNEWMETRDATEYTVKKVFSAPGSWITLWYDFGDDWRVTVKLEQIDRNSTLPAKALPRVLEGAGFGIVEDCGGPYGLTQLARAFQKKKGEVYETFRDWLGTDEFDIEAFDLEDMNFRLQKIPRIYKQIYEQRQYPTQRSINLIERRYEKGKP